MPSHIWTSSWVYTWFFIRRALWQLIESEAFFELQSHPSLFGIIWYDSSLRGWWITTQPSFLRVKSVVLIYIVLIKKENWYRTSFLPYFNYYRVNRRVYVTLLLQQYNQRSGEEISIGPLNRVGTLSIGNYDCFQWVTVEVTSQKTRIIYHLRKEESYS